FLKEIWCIKMGGRVVITTSRDGYLRIANRGQHFRGLVSDAVYAKDKFAKTKDGVDHSYSSGDRGQIVGAYALVYRDDRNYPTYFFAPFRDYYKRGDIWDKYPHAMIIKVAEAMALKRAFAISGLTTQEEIGTDVKAESAQAQVQAQVQADREREIQLNQLYQRYLAVCGGVKAHVINAMKKITGKDKSADFTQEDIKALFDDVIRREDEKMNTEIGFTTQTTAEQAEQTSSPLVFDAVSGEPIGMI
ncbi:MAG: recombinase RecT, partial [Synergistaceae bacterium]|nr:recombinase RecT [Synergistaceae bacterium]